MDIDPETVAMEIGVGSNVHYTLGIAVHIARSRRYKSG